MRTAAVPDEAMSADRVALGSTFSYVESTSGVRPTLTQINTRVSPRHMMVR